MDLTTLFDQCKEALEAAGFAKMLDDFRPTHSRTHDAAIPEEVALYSYPLRNGSGDAYFVVVEAEHMGGYGEKLFVGKTRSGIAVAATAAAHLNVLFHGAAEAEAWELPFRPSVPLVRVG